MSHVPTPSAPPEIDALDALDAVERALLDRQLEALGRLADMGMVLAAAITQAATTAPEPAPDLSHASLDFARASRAVRLTFALQSRLIAEFKGPGSKASGSAKAGQDSVERFGRPDIVDNDVVRKRQLQGVVQRLGEGASMESEAVERLVAEAGERLEDDRFYRELTERPIGEMVALICKDLGVEPDWGLLADHWWARLEIEQPPPGSPYAGWQAQTESTTKIQRHQPPPLVPSG